MNDLLLVSIFLTSLAGIVILTKYAKKLGLIDIPNERSIHKTLYPEVQELLLF